MSIPTSLNKKQLRETLNIVDNRTLKRVCINAGINWVKGYQIFTQKELSKIFTHWDYEENEQNT